MLTRLRSFLKCAARRQLFYRTSSPPRSRDTLGATLYLAGRDAKNGQLLHDATSCSMCRRVIINAGISRVVIRKGDKEYDLVHVEDWVREDDSLPEKSS